MPWPDAGTRPYDRDAGGRGTFTPGPGWALVRPRQWPEKLAASAVRAVTHGISAGERLGRMRETVMPSLPSTGAPSPVRQSVRPSGRLAAPGASPAGLAAASALSLLTARP